jgi:hypothetical protein
MSVKKLALIESIANIGSGFFLSLFIFQPFIFWVYDIEMPLNDNLVIAIYFTIIGITRAYLWRIYFHKFFYQ